MMTLEKTYPTATLAEVAGVSVSKLHQWRCRYGLLPKPRDAWPRWTVAEICAARFVSVMVKHGLPISDAASIATNVVYFDAHSPGYAEKIGTRCIAIYRNGGAYSYDSVPEGVPVETILTRPHEIITIIHVREIIDLVRNRLAVLAAKENAT